MNHRACICLLAAATLAACGQPPYPGTPRAMPRAEVTTTTSTEASTTTVEPPPTTTTTTPPPKPPPPTTIKPPPPKPKPPNRLVVTSELRGSIEQRTPNPLPDVWPGIQSDLNELCPDKVPCVGYVLTVDPSSTLEGDCVIVGGGIKIPDPLFEGGKVSLLVNNKKNCTPG